MAKLPIWDSHVHIFPPEIYENWEKYSVRDPWFRTLTRKPENGKGTEEAWANAEEALDCAQDAGIYGLVMQGWYWNDEGLQTLHNDYMADRMAAHPDRLRGFCCINPKFGDRALYEMERCKKLGFSGVGELGPGGNGYDFCDPDFLAVLDCAQQLEMPVCIHCGEPVGHVYPGKDVTSLAPIPELVRKRPKLKLILAHLGGGMPFYEMNPHYRGRFDNVYYDTAANPLLYRIESFRAVIHMIGSERLLYGSDFPLLLYPSRCREMNFSLFLSEIRGHAGLTGEEWDAVMGGNICRLLSIR